MTDFFFDTKLSCFLSAHACTHTYCRPLQKQRGIICVTVSSALCTWEGSWQETQNKNLWERHVNVSRWDGQSLTFPSTPTPQSASWIMLTSFPPSPKRKQKPQRCQDSHRWLTNKCLERGYCLCRDTPLIWTWWEEQNGRNSLDNPLLWLWNNCRPVNTFYCSIVCCNLKTNEKNYCSRNLYSSFKNPVHSPTAHVSFPVRSCSSRTICAFWVGAHRQQTTAGHWHASSMNSYS